ncbi:MAG: polyprenyl synthetase family protein [Bacteroidia bacterium]|nr:polyprenyl synthetase family protein [Bacteroidia bacterium]
MAIPAQITLPIQDYFALYEEAYAKSLHSKDAILKPLIQHVRQSSGKQMRPILVLLCARLCGDITQNTLHAAIALELLHVASLIHDDVVDESDKRRGYDSVRAKFNNKIAVLGGDFILSSALSQAASTESAAIVKVIASLGKQLSEGELLQLETINENHSNEKKYFDIISQKTAALFAACARLGVTSSTNTDIETEQKIVSIGELIGICFQLKDDIFDYEPSNKIGKPTGIDLAEGKLTLPLIHVIETSNDADKQRIKEAFKNKEISYLQDLAHQKGGIQYATEKLHELQEKALSILNEFPESPARTAIKAYIEYVADRKY